MTRRRWTPEWLPEVVFGVTCGVLGGYLGDRYPMLGNIFLVIGSLAIASLVLHRLRERRRSEGGDGRDTQ